MKGSNRFGTIALVLLTVSFGLMVMSFFLPWWGQSTSVAVQDDRGVEMEVRYADTVSHRPADLQYQSSASLYSTTDSLSTFLRFMFFWNIAVMVSLSLFVVSLVMFILDGGGGKRFLVVIGVITLVLLIIGPLVFAIGLPVAMKLTAVGKVEAVGGSYDAPDGDDPVNSFRGTNVADENVGGSVSEVHRSWGPDLGFFLPIAALLFTGPALLLAALSRRMEDADQVVPQGNDTQGPEDAQEEAQVLEDEEWVEDLEEFEEVEEY